MVRNGPFYSYGVYPHAGVHVPGPALSVIDRFPDSSVFPSIDEAQGSLPPSEDPRPSISYLSASDPLLLLLVTSVSLGVHVSGTSPFLGFHKSVSFRVF